MTATLPTSPGARPAWTAALLTPPGRGAIATIRVCHAGVAGEQLDTVPFRAADGRPLSRQPPGRVAFGHWGLASQEEVVVCRNDQSMLEIHCHGGDAAARRILTDLADCGCPIEPWLEQAAQREGRLEAACRQALSQATTLRTAEILLDQLQGTLRQALCGLVFRGSERALDELLGWSTFGRHLSRPWSVVLAGRPNAGKSSLVNALLGYSRSIVSDLPGTTRDVVTAETALDGWPVWLADTAGVRAPTGAVEAQGIHLAQTTLEEADCQVILIDHSVPASTTDRELLARWPDAVIVAHKSDLPRSATAEIPPSAIAVSSLTGAGLEALDHAIVRRLIPRVPPAGTAIPVADWQVELLQQARAASVAEDRAARERCLGELLR